MQRYLAVQERSRWLGEHLLKDSFKFIISFLSEEDHCTPITLITECLPIFSPSYGLWS